MLGFFFLSFFFGCDGERGRLDWEEILAFVILSFLKIGLDAQSVDGSRFKMNGCMDIMMYA